MLLSEDLKVERIEIKINNLPSKLSGLKIVQLSDLHYDGESLSPQLLEKAIAINNQEYPDLITITGDFVTHNPRVIKNLLPYLEKLTRKIKIYACLGNHDIYYGHSKNIIINSLESIGIKVLWNQIDYLFQGQLAIVGLADILSLEFQPELILPQINPKIPTIVLSHSPDTMAINQQYPIDLQLSGHSHGGQIILPIIGVLPAYLSELRKIIPSFLHPHIPYLNMCAKVMKHWEWSRGYFKVGDSQLYVNRGLGSYFPGRIGCPPEITIIRLIC